MGGILSTYTKMSRGGFVRGGFCPTLNLPSITVNQIKKSTLGTKVLQGQESYYDGNFWYFGF